MQPPTSTLARKRGLRDAGLLWQSWLAGLRVSEACTLRWRDVNLPAGRLTVRQSKTEAGLREVDMLPLLRDELSAHRASVMPDDPELPVFTTSAGRPRDRSNVRPRVMAPAIERANELLAERDLPPLPEGLTAHKLRHTYGSVLAARGEDPAYEMAHLGHTDPKFTLRVCTHLMRRREGERDRLRALVAGADWAETGRKAQAGVERHSLGLTTEGTESRAVTEGEEYGRGWFRTSDLSRVRRALSH
jgi:integrase